MKETQKPKELGTKAFLSVEQPQDLDYLRIYTDLHRVEPGMRLVLPLERGEPHPKHPGVPCFRLITKDRGHSNPDLLK